MLSSPERISAKVSLWPWISRYISIYMRHRYLADISLRRHERRFNQRIGQFTLQHRSRSRWFICVPLFNIAMSRTLAEAKVMPKSETIKMIPTLAFQFWTDSLLWLPKRSKEFTILTPLTFKRRKCQSSIFHEFTADKSIQPILRLSPYVFNSNQPEMISSFTDFLDDSNHSLADVLRNENFLVDGQCRTEYRGISGPLYYLAN